MTPLVYHYPNDKNTWGIKDQFFFGESLMICNVTEYKQRQKEIYLPEGIWYNFWTGKKGKTTGKITIETPLDETPIYVKAGSILPIGPKVQFATELTKDPIEIVVYPGADGEFVMYFDDNESYNYEDKTYSEVVFTYSDVDKTLKVKKGIDTYIVFEDSPKVFLINSVDQARTEKIYFKGEEIIIKL